MVKKEKLKTKEENPDKEKKGKKEKAKDASKKSSKKTVGKSKDKKTEVKKIKDKKNTPKDSTKEDEGIILSESDNYLEAIGRRKTSVAVVRLFTKGKKEFIVNDKSYDEYFSTFELQESCSASLKKMKCLNTFRITVKVNGGGINSQMEAIRHGISRALVLFNPDFKKRLRRAGYLTRDPRQRERKKPGLKRARKAPQWKKR